MDIVASTWNMKVLDRSGRKPTPMFTIVQKLEALKSRSLQVQHKSSITQLRQEDIQLNIQEDPRNANLHRQEQSLRAQLLLLLAYDLTLDNKLVSHG